MIRSILRTLFLATALVSPTLAQDAYQPKTTADVNVDTAKTLPTMLRPLQLDQLEAEAKAWQQVLAAKATEISNAEIAGTDASALRAEQDAIVERFKIVLKAFANLGGDREPFDKYLDAATALNVDASDPSALVTMATDWITAPTGGIQLAINFGKFLLTLLVFRLLSGILASIVRKAVGRIKGASDLLRDFFVNVTRRIIFFIGLIVALSMLNVDVTPFVAALGAAGFVIGFALQGTLSNFASGLMILIYRPYDIGEVVTVAGTTGKVDAMTLVSTTLRLPDNQTVVIPNNSIWGDVITNVTGQQTRRVDMVFGCGYGDDLQKAQDLLTEIVTKHPKVHADPAPVVKVHELADSSVNFVVRPWTNTADYWDVFWDVTRQVKERFDKEGLNIPYPQREVHVHQVTG